MFLDHNLYSEVVLDTLLILGLLYRYSMAHNRKKNNAYLSIRYHKHLILMEKCYVF